MRQTSEKAAFVVLIYVTLPLTLFIKSRFLVECRQRRHVERDGIREDVSSGDRVPFLGYRSTCSNFNSCSDKCRLFQCLLHVASPLKFSPATVHAFAMVEWEILNASKYLETSFYVVSASYRCKIHFVLDALKRLTSGKLHT